MIPTCLDRPMSNRAPREYENLSIEQVRQLTIPADEWNDEPDFEPDYDEMFAAQERTWDMRHENAAW